MSEVHSKILATDLDHLPAAEPAMSHPVTDVKQFRRARLGDDFGHELSGYRTVRRTRRNCDRFWRCETPLHFCAAVITMATIAA